MDDDKNDSVQGPGKDRRIESLGWLTESSVMPGKRRAIAGVGASSIVELRAQLYRTQEDARRVKEGAVDVELRRSRKKIELFDKTNAGVEGRANRDKLQLKAETDGSTSYAALEKKAELYEKLVRGELPDEEGKEKYSVDFLRKGLLEDEFEEMEREGRGERTSVDDSRQEGIPMSASVESRSGIGWSRDGATGTGQEHKLLVRQVNEETVEAREKATLLKQRRQLQAEKNREKLRQAFIKKKLEKLKAAARKEKESGLPKSSDAEHIEGEAD